MEFQKKYSFEQRKSEACKILQKFPDRLPIIVSTDPKEFKLDKHKYLVPRDLTLGQFIYVLRHRIKIDSTKSIFIFCMKSLPPISSNIADIYDRNVDNDGFLYFEVRGENTFG